MPRPANQQVCPRQEQPGFTYWGSFAEYVAVPYAEANLVRLPDEIGFDAAAALGCRFATAYRGVAQVGAVAAGGVGGGASAAAASGCPR